jgi:hypothetical protein
MEIGQTIMIEIKVIEKVDKEDLITEIKEEMMREEETTTTVKITKETKGADTKEDKINKEAKIKQESLMKLPRLIPIMIIDKT